MPMVFKADETTGKAAIYEVASLASVPTDPLTDPDNNASVVHFHSDWYYPQVVGNSHTGTATLPLGGADTFQNGTLTLFAHGIATAPMVFGTITIGSTVLSLAGDVVVERTTSNGSTNWTWVSLEVDDTNVYLRYYGALRFGTGTTPTASVSYSIQVTDMQVSGAGPVGDPFEPVAKYRPSPDDYLTMGRGKIDTRRKYIKRASGSGIQIPYQQTLQMIGRAETTNGIQNGVAPLWGYSLNGYKAPSAISGSITINPSFSWAQV